MFMSEPASTGHPLRIFVVENHRDTLAALTHYLNQMGHTVVSAGTVEGALKALPGSRCDVFICDIGLPDGDGWELLKRARLEPHVYTIAMSGFGHKSDCGRSEAAGYRRHLLKPFFPDDLDGILAEAAAGA